MKMTKSMSVCGMTTALFAIGLMTSVQADVILDEPNLKGTVGLTGESFGSGQVYAFWNGGSINTQLTNGDTDFALRVEPGKTSSLSVYMYSFQNTPGAQLNQYLTGIAALGPAEVRTLDLKREAGRIRGSINVTGGSVKRIQMQTSAQASSTESYSGYVTATTAPFTPLQPMPALSNAKVSGSATFAATAGCDVTMSLSEKTATVSAGGVADVNWTFDLSAVRCNLGGIQGDVALSGLSGVNADASVRQHTVQAHNGSVSSSKTLSGDGSYLISDLSPNNYYVSLNSYFNQPYGYLYYPNTTVSVVGGQVTTHDLLKSVGTLHGTIKPKGVWGMSDVYNMHTHFRSNSGGISFYDYTDTTGKFDLVALAGDSYLYYIRPHFYKNTGTRTHSQYYYRYYNSVTSPVKAAIQAGDRLENRDVEFETSAIDQGFYLAKNNVGIKNLTITGRDYTAAGALIGSKEINLTSNLTGSGIPTNDIVARLYGETACYKGTAVADGDDGGTYRKEFAFSLMAPQYTAVGYSGTPLEFSSCDNSYVGSVEFIGSCSTPTEGYTIINTSNIGPKPPENFKVYSNQNDNVNSSAVYYDVISTVAGFCKAMVCFKYDGTDGTPKGNLRLGHYNCEKSPCKWEDITSNGYPDDNNVICGETDSFSIFAILEPLDNDDDGIFDSEDNCKDVANPDQADNDNDSIGDVCDPDDDNDTVLDTSDNCPLAVNADQADNDNDSIGNICDNDDDNDDVADSADNCSFSANTDQSDRDSDGQGDVCDGDQDGDSFANEADNCPAVANADQADTDGDGQGDVCDLDDDNDGVADDQPDNCPLLANTDQQDMDSDNIGDFCDIDKDGDGVENAGDNCELTANADQEDTDSDTFGDACDDDDDNDGVLDAADNCSLMHNPGQENADGDAQGDVCDGDLDGDSVANEADNCPNVANASQNDHDSDGKGDACDNDVDGDGVANDSDACALTVLNAVVNPAEGCSIDQLCPCEGPRGTTGAWKNHGSYVSCTAKSAESFLAAELITQAEKDAVCSEAGQSACGVKK